MTFIDPSCSLENYGFEGWCMDHVIPSSKFSLEDIDKCLHWSNVRPLSISKNSKKHKYLKREELDKHLEILKNFTQQNKELILKENIKIPEFDRYSYLDPSSV
jgi:DNA-binding transcriptional MerR regulator